MWHYWVRVAILVWFEWLVKTLIEQFYAPLHNYLWVVLSTVIVVKPVTILTLHIGSQRILGMVAGAPGTMYCVSERPCLGLFSPLSTNTASFSVSMGSHCVPMALWW